MLEQYYAGDSRKGIQKAIEKTRKRLEREAAEASRVDALYTYEQELARSRNAGVILGLDEVGRGPVAGPFAVGGVVLPLDGLHLAGLNDSKQVKPSVREALATEIQTTAQAYTVQFIEPAEIDAAGMSACLTRAFKRAIDAIESAGVIPDIILLDGNPLHLDTRELNVIKGDSLCASIAAASIIAKVARDARMIEYHESYPQYDFASNKGYASALHIDAIKQFGLSTIHRKSFCTSFLQESLF